MRFAHGFTIALSIAVLGSGCADVQDAPDNRPPDGNQGINTAPDTPAEQPESGFPPADQGSTDRTPPGGGLESDFPAQPSTDSGANIDSGGYFDGDTGVDSRESETFAIDATQNGDRRPSDDVPDNTSGGDRYADILPQNPSEDAEVELPSLGEGAE